MQQYTIPTQSSKVLPHLGRLLLEHLTVIIAAFIYAFDCKISVMFPFFSLIIFVGMINFGQSFRHSLSRRNPVKFRRPLYSKATNTPDFSKEITSKYFDFCSAEEKIYRWWESQNYFKPIEKKGEKPFVIPMVNALFANNRRS